MRLLIDSLIALMLLGILAAVLLHHHDQQEHLRQIRAVHEALADLEDQALFRGALIGNSQSQAERFPPAISPTWFDHGLPDNLLVPGRQPWIDVAPESDDNDNPPDPVLTRPTQAKFWYNPSRGIFRARVPRQFSDQATLDLYNLVNGTYLRSLDPSKTGSAAGRTPHLMSYKFGPSAALAPAKAPAKPPRPTLFRSSNP